MLTLITLEDQIPRRELIKDGEVIPEVIEIFNSWFDSYSTDNRMMNEHLARFLKIVVNSKDMPELDDKRITNLFETYDKGKNGYLEREGFVKFYTLCTLDNDPNKRSTVWQNLNEMGVRNDLKNISEPYQSFNSDPKMLPRYLLAHDQVFFNTIFNLQELNKEIARDAYDFLNIITTNPVIYKQILFSGKSNEEIKWESQLDEKNIYKLTYSLQIIESFLEDIELTSDNVDSFSNEEIILGMKDISLNELKNMKMEWMKVFIKNDGYSFLIHILEKKLIEYSRNVKDNVENSLMSNICLDLLLRISRIFFSSSLNKFKVYRKINDYISNLRGEKKSDNIVDKDNQVNNVEEVENDLLLLRKQSSNMMDSNELAGFFKGELGEKILNSFQNPDIMLNIIEMLMGLIGSQKRSEEESNILETSFSFFGGLLGFSPNAMEVEKVIMSSNNKQFEKVCLFGLLNKDLNTRLLFSNSLITLCMAARSNQRFEFISYMFTFIFNFIENMDSNQEKYSSELFDLFSNLFETYLMNEKQIEKGKNIKIKI